MRKYAAAIGICVLATYSAWCYASIHGKNEKKFEAATNERKTHELMQLFSIYVERHKVFPPADHWEDVVRKDVEMSPEDWEADMVPVTPSGVRPERYAMNRAICGHDPQKNPTDQYVLLYPSEASGKNLVGDFDALPACSEDNTASVLFVPCGHIPKAFNCRPAVPGEPLMFSTSRDIGIARSRANTAVFRTQNVKAVK